MELLLIHGAYREGELVARGSFSHSRDDYFLELERVRLQHEVLLLSASLKAHGPANRPKSYPPRNQRALVSASGNRETIRSVRTGHGADVSVGHRHAGAAHRSALLRGDAARDNRLGPEWPGQKECECYGRRGAEQGVKTGYTHYLPPERGVVANIFHWLPAKVAPTWWGWRAHITIWGVVTAISN